MNQLTYFNLLEMINEEVLVIDTVPMSNGCERLPQKCIFNIKDGLITLSNDIYEFEYGKDGSCMYGGFDVYDCNNY